LVLNEELNPLNGCGAGFRHCLCGTTVLVEFAMHGDRKTYSRDTAHEEIDCQQTSIEMPKKSEEDAILTSKLLGSLDLLMFGHF
jgi:hypothetical protein